VMPSRLETRDEREEKLAEGLEQRYRDEFERTLDAKIEAVLETEKT
jgi:hypothetical protein